MSISFLITVHNEARELSHVLGHLLAFFVKNQRDDEIVILDDFSTDQSTIDCIEHHKKYPFVKVYQHALNGDFGSHKTWGSRKCTKEFICQLDADEYLSTMLLDNIHDIIEANPTVEVYMVPRVNIVRGLTPEDASKWGWRVTEMAQFPMLKIVNYPDRQSRIYKNDPRIYWEKKLHETIVGGRYVTEIPSDPMLSIVHDKTIDRQRAQNEFYMKNFTLSQNQGRG